MRVARKARCRDCQVAWAGLDAPCWMCGKAGEPVPTIGPRHSHHRWQPAEMPQDAGRT